MQNHPVPSLLLNIACVLAPFLLDPSSQELPLSDDIRDQPELVLKCMSLAFYQVPRKKSHQVDTLLLPRSHLVFLTPPPLFQALIAIRQMQDSTYTSAERIDVRLANFTPVTPLRRLKANYIGECNILLAQLLTSAVTTPLPLHLPHRQICGRQGHGSACQQHQTPRHANALSLRTLR